jgi:hypothetical protein
MNDLVKRLRACCECEQAPLGPLLGNAADRIEELEAQVAALKAELEVAKLDSDRIDKLEQSVLDGSYLSILNDVVYTTKRMHEIFGPGPSLRTVIDSLVPAMDADTKAAIDAARRGA